MSGLLELLTPDGTRRIAVHADEYGRVPVSGDEAENLDSMMLLELRAIRIGLALLLKQKPADLLKLAQERGVV